MNARVRRYARPCHCPPCYPENNLRVFEQNNSCVIIRVILITVLAASALEAQGKGAPALPARFSLSAPEPFLRKPVQRTRFAEAVGRRAALLGREDGTFEAWINPVRILRDFHLSVYLGDAITGVPLADVAESIVVSPGRTTITHAHAAFTIRQTWFAPLDRQALILLLDIDTSRTLRLPASFVP